MFNRIQLVAVSALLVLSASVAAAQTGSLLTPPARRAQGAAGAPLTLPSAAPPRAVLAQFLAGQGRSQATIDSLAEIARNSGRQEILHVRFEQRVAGLPVYGTYARAAFGPGGELISLVENLVDAPPIVAGAAIDAEQAVAAAVANLYPALRQIPPGFFRSAPSATAVAVPQANGAMQVGFVVQTWTQQSNQLHETLIGGAGAVLAVESRTQNTGDQYNVFRVHPDVTPQEVASGPGSGNAESPAGWLFATTQGTTSISGNNVHAYLDAVSDNASDGLGSQVGNGHFLTAADLTVSPSVQQNRAVAVQNLFFLNNLIHDELYRHGFTEATGNFQENNFGNGGLGSDSVNAEAQDGGGTDNANFATPSDGSNPRMQMYLWTGHGPTHTVVAGGQTFAARGATWGPALDTTGITSTIRLVNDGVATTTDGCDRMPRGSLNGVIALVDRGNCNFTLKAENVQTAGAIALIVANNTGTDETILMGGTVRRPITIPGVFVSFNSGTTLKAMVPVSGTVRLADVQPLQKDSDVDADIVFHEYCHGLTWRMIGSMSGPMSGAIGEGMSDVCAMLMTAIQGGRRSLLPGADRIGEYSFSNAFGIRRQPYAGYDLTTYGQLEGESVHNDGEVYAAIGWRMYELFGHARKDELFGYLVDGMNYTPAGPSYEDMRDGILQSILTTSPNPAADSCLVWKAFAQYGVGVGAAGVARGQRLAITESFALPAACQP